VKYVDRAEFPISVHKARNAFRVAIVCSLISCAGYAPAQAQPSSKTKPVTKPAGKTVPKAALEKFEQPDPDKLPPGFQPAPEPLAIMDLDQPLATTDELAKLKKEVVSKFAKTLRDCDLSATGKQVIETGVRYRLAEMTLKEKRKELPELHKALIRDITTGIGNPGIKPADVASMVQFVNQELVKQIPQLLVNNFYVRLHAVLILSELDYAPSHALLLQVIQSKEIQEDPVLGQPSAIKIAATQGLTRILKYASPPVAQRTIIAHALVDELQKPNTHWWYQLRLIEALRHMTVAVDAGNNKPFVIDQLFALINDRERPWTVRSKACFAIGRVPIPAAVKPEDVVNTVADFALQLSTAAQAKPNDPVWKSCVWDVYLAFKADGSKDKDGKDKDQDAERKGAGGLLARIKPVAQPAYDRIVPIVRDVIHGKSPDAGDVKNLGDFVRERVPQK
jgi:hypothetical protein